MTAHERGGWWEATMAGAPGVRHADGVAPLTAQHPAPEPLLRRTAHAPPRLDMFERPATFSLRLADVDPDLVAGLDGDLAVAAAHHLVAPLVHLRTGSWEPPVRGQRFDDWLGILVLDGLLIREVEIDRLRCCELLGPGDLLRPWDEDDGNATLATHATWRVVEPSRVALLDAAFVRRACRWPSVVTELMHRCLVRSRSQSVFLATTQARRADVRLRTVFWHLADRWGRVTPEGVRVELALTHTVISRLTGLRRPTVSINLAKLEASGEIVRLGKSEWLIRRDVGRGELAA
jgi:CRP/FNR family transcriptional regulator, cyclic AMP receptor protein